MRKILFIILFILFAVTGRVFAEVLELKSKDKITCNIIEKNPRYIKIDYKGSPITYYTFEVESIDGKPVSFAEKSQKEKSKHDPGEITQFDAVTAEDYLKRGIAYGSKGNFDQAIADFNRAINVKNNFAEAYLNRGLTYMAANKPDLALADYSKALEIDPKYEEAYYIRGLSFADKGNPDRAIADYTRAIEINPEYIQAYLNRAFLNINKGNFEDAISDIGKIIAINPDVPVAYYMRGIAYTNKGNFEQAITDFSKAIKLKSDYAEAYAYRGLARAYENKIDPNSPKAFINIGPTYGNKADFEQALSDCKKAIELNPKYADAYVNRIKVCLLSQDYDLAWQDVRKLEELGYKVSPGLIEELKKASGSP